MIWRQKKEGHDPRSKKNNTKGVSYANTEWICNLRKVITWWLGEIKVIGKNNNKYLLKFNVDFIDHTPIRRVKQELKKYDTVLENINTTGIV